MFCFLTIEPQLTEAIARTGNDKDRVRQFLNNHTGSFYLPEFLSKIQTTASSLSVRHDPGGGGGTVFARITLATQGTLRRIAPQNINPNNKGF